MTAAVTTFALIGRSFSSETFQDLHNVSVAARAARRPRRAERVMRVVIAAHDALVVPKRLSA